MDLSSFHYVDPPFNHTLDRARQGDHRMLFTINLLWARRQALLQTQSDLNRSFRTTTHPSLQDGPTAKYRWLLIGF